MFERFLANMPILDFYYILTRRIDQIFPVLSYLPRSRKLLAQTEHLAYLFLGLVVARALGAIPASVVFAACMACAVPIEARIMKRGSLRLPTWEWAKNQPYRGVFVVLAWVSINLTSYYFMGVYLARVIFP